MESNRDDRSTIMRAEINPWKVVKGKYIVLKKIKYRILDRTVTNFNQKCASIGAYADDREIILLNNKSITLKNLYSELQEFIERSNTFDDRLKKVMLYVKIIFSYHYENDVNEFINTWQGEKYETPSGKKVPVISIDDFIENKIGVCRHHALLTAYFLNRLIENELLPDGEIHQNRDRIINGAHTWLAYKCENGIYSIDSTWDKKAFHFQDSKIFLANRYGEKAIEHFEKRYITEEENANNNNEIKKLNIYKNSLQSYCLNFFSKSTTIKERNNSFFIKLKT